MVYSTGVDGPVQTEFFRQLGATEFFFGLLGGIPMALLSLQFVGAAITNVLQQRKHLFIFNLIFGRLLYLPIVFTPILFPSLGQNAMLYILLGFLTLSSALMNTAAPSWYSWMADVIPRRILGTYWGQRQRYMQFTWTFSFLLVAALIYLFKMPVTMAYAILVVVAVTAGVADIALFSWVDEPPNTQSRHIPIWGMLKAPFIHSDFRSFVLYSCAWSASSMIAAAFTQLYFLKIMGLNIWQTTLVWSVVGIGSGIAAKWWGKVIRQSGQRPVLIICTIFKPIIILVFIFVTPDLALWVLPPALFIDSFWQAGIFVASECYIMKIAPKQNRSMFVASFTGLSGICGGLAAIGGGTFLSLFTNFHFSALGRVWGNFHLLFILAFVMRAGCLFLALRVREPKSTSSVQVMGDILSIWPLRYLRGPVSFNRRRKD